MTSIGGLSTGFGACPAETAAKMQTSWIGPIAGLAAIAAGFEDRT